MTDNLDMHDRIVLYGYSGDGSRELSPHELLQVYPPAEIDQNLLDKIEPLAPRLFTLEPLNLDLFK